MSNEAPDPQAGATTTVLPPGITVRGLRASYGRIEVLHGVDLEVPAGSVFALLGPNGAGKSTLLKVMSGRMRPTAGEVLIGDTPIGKTPAEKLVRQGVCAVPEGRGIFPNLTVRENLRMMTYVGRSLSDIEEVAYSRFPRLQERRTQTAGTMSGGEQQMLAMARGMATEPALLILDELSMGLAPIIVAELYEMVAQVAKSGVSILVVEQFASTVLGVADYAAIMVHGRIERIGRPDELEAAALTLAARFKAETSVTRGEALLEANFPL